MTWDPDLMVYEIIRPYNWVAPEGTNIFAWQGMFESMIFRRSQGFDMYPFPGN